MIVLNVTYKCKPEMREAFLERILAEGIDVKSRTEEGNYKYDYYLPFEDNGELLLLEKWKDAEALATHGEQPHFLLLGEFKSDYVTDTIVEKFVVE